METTGGSLECVRFKGVPLRVPTVPTQGFYVCFRVLVLSVVRF